MTVLDSLKKYFEENTREQIEKDWKLSEKFGKIGPTVDEFMENTIKVNRTLKDNNLTKSMDLLKISEIKTNYNSIFSDDSFMLAC